MPQSRRSNSLLMDTYDLLQPEDWDRRASERIRIALAVRQRVRNTVVLCQAGDLSPTGMLLARASGAAREECQLKCWLEFGLPGTDDLIAARGRVVRDAARGPYYLMGVRFTSMAPSHRRRLGDYLRDGAEPETELQAFETHQGPPAVRPRSRPLHPPPTPVAVEHTAKSSPKERRARPGTFLHH